MPKKTKKKTKKTKKTKKKNGNQILLENPLLYAQLEDCCSQTSLGRNQNKEPPTSGGSTENPQPIRGALNFETSGTTNKINASRSKHVLGFFIGLLNNGDRSAKLWDLEISQAGVSWGLDSFLKMKDWSRAVVLALPILLLVSGIAGCFEARDCLDLMMLHARIASRATGQLQEEATDGQANWLLDERSASLQQIMHISSKMLSLADPDGEQEWADEIDPLLACPSPVPVDEAIIGLTRVVVWSRRCHNLAVHPDDFATDAEACDLRLQQTILALAGLCGLEELLSLYEAPPHAHAGDTIGVHTISLDPSADNFTAALLEAVRAVLGKSSDLDGLDESQLEDVMRQLQHTMSSLGHGDELDIEMGLYLESEVEFDDAGAPPSSPSKGLPSSPFALEEYPDEEEEKERD